MNFPIFVGVEYLSLEGDIVAFGFDKLPDKKHMSAQDFINYVNSKGGVCISAHPYRNNSRGLGDELFNIKGLCAVEVLNGSASDYANKKAYEACKKLNLQMIGASDCHDLISLGRYATYVPYDCKNVDDLVYALKNLKVEPVLLSGYKKYEFDLS